MAFCTRNMHIFIFFIVTNILSHSHCTHARDSSIIDNVNNRYKPEKQTNQQSIANQRRQLLSISTSIASVSSSGPKSKDSKSGLMQLIQDADKFYILWFVIGVLVIAICGVSCCCLYYFNRTQTASKKIQKLSISKPSKINIIKPPNNGVRSPTGNTVATYSSFTTNPTLSPAGLSVQSAQSEVSYNHIQLPTLSTRNKSYRSVHSYNPAHKIPSDCDQSLSADETIQPVVLTNNSTITSAQEQSTIRSLDVDDIQLTPNVSVESGNDYVGYVMNYNNNNNPGAQTWQQIQSHSNNSVPGSQSYVNNRNMNQNNNAIWNNAPHRNTVQVMRPMAYPQNAQRVQQHPASGSSPYAQHNMQRNVKDTRFRFQPQYQYPQAPKQPQYNMKVMRREIDIPPPPAAERNERKEGVNKFGLLQIVTDDTSEKEMTHITSSTIASLNTADYEDSNTDSVSCSTKQTEETGNERYDTCTTDMTQITAQIHAHKETFASHTMHAPQETVASNTVETQRDTVVSHTVCDSDMFENESKGVASVIFAVSHNVNSVNAVAASVDTVDDDDGTYMKLQRNLKFLDTKSVFDVTLDCEPEHSPNNSMMSIDNIKDISVNSLDSHTL